MKISQLPLLPQASPSALIPISIGGENFSLSVGQIASLLSLQVVRFAGVRNDPNVFFTMGSSTDSSLPVIFDAVRGKFYAEYAFEGFTTYYKDFPGKNRFYSEDDAIATDSLFVADNGDIYFYNGTTLVPAGAPTDMPNQLTTEATARANADTDLGNQIGNVNNAVQDLVQSLSAVVDDISTLDNTLSEKFDVSDFVVLSEDEYEAITPAEDKFYFIYED